MNRWTDFQKRMIVLGIALLLILFGAAQAIFKFDFFTKYKRIIDDVTFVLMVFAAVLLFSNKKRRPEPERPEKTEETTSDAQTKDSNNERESLND